MTTLASSFANEIDQSTAPEFGRAEPALAPSGNPFLQPGHVTITVPKPSEPAIHVHTLSDPTGKEEFDHLLRPVIAEQSERHIPKDDLLTPRDVAKAFQLEFGIQQEHFDRYFDQPSIARRFKVLLTCTICLIVAVGLGWPMIRVVSAWVNPSAASAAMRMTQSDQPVAIAALQNNLIADARPASDRIPAPRPIPIKDPTPASTEVHTVSSADPIIVADPASSTSSADDPNILWNTGLDAESAGKYDKAVEAYERIESLPSYVWPAHLEVRLALARKELKGDVK